MPKVLDLLCFRPHPRPLSRGEGIVEVRELVGKSNFFLFSSLFKLHFYPEYSRIRISPYFKWSTRRGRGSNFNF